MAAVRRKRDDDSTFHSQCSGSLALDASQSSMAVLDTSTVGTDSSMPRPRRKRRRTNILEQLQHIDISNEKGVPDQILEQGVQDDNSQNLTSSDSEAEDGDISRILPPSDVELTEKAVMRDLVFGRPPDPPLTNPVDRKIQSLVRSSLDNVKKGSHPFVFRSNNIASSQDDMNIEPVYTRPSDPVFFNGGGTRVGVWAQTAPIPPPGPTIRKRSNSLPEGLMDDIEDAAMDIN